MLGRAVMFNSGYTENISALLEFHPKPLAQKVESYIKDFIDFLRKIDSLSPLPDDIILCTIDVDFHPNISHNEGFIVLRKSLESRKGKTISTDSQMDLAEQRTIFLSTTCLLLSKRPQGEQP